ncbi:uncharacterized protein LOC141622584 [Silene latifolia]|uniref:uncharacterized protein LOC141622584 n=1 Tax=Silene latifolia TaxID=37657 RepID=UPI003D76A77D
MITVDWSKLTLELLVRIVETHLPAVEDVIMFSSVCNSWNRAARACDKSKLRVNWSRQMPWLMLTDGNDSEFCDEYEHKELVDELYIDEGDDEFESYYRLNEVPLQKALYDNKRMLLNLSNNGRNKLYCLSLPETYGKACWGSRCGWIVTLGLDREMQLFNPLTKSQLPLPSQTTFGYPCTSAQSKTIRAMFFSKVVVLRLPQDDNDNIPWLVVAIHSVNSHVGIARPGDASWTHIHNPYYSDPDDPPITDVIYCNKMKSLVFIDESASLFYYDVHNPKQPKELKVCLKVQGILFSEQQVDTQIYLVESGDDLLAIVRCKKSSSWEPNHVHGINCHNNDNFRVFRSGFATTRSWEELKDGIGNVAVFVGGNETMCIDASIGGCRSNCIYFSDVHRESYRNRLYYFDEGEVSSHLGVFNFNTKTTESFYNWKIRESPYCSPFWFTPSI